MFIIQSSVEYHGVCFDNIKHSGNCRQSIMCIVLSGTYYYSKLYYQGYKNLAVDSIINDLIVMNTRMTRHQNSNCEYAMYALIPIVVCNSIILNIRTNKQIFDDVFHCIIIVSFWNAWLCYCCLQSTLIWTCNFKNTTKKSLCIHDSTPPP